MPQPAYRRKLIEVDLPLKDISLESGGELSGNKPGHPMTFHPYWARRPLAACRAVIFASMVDDPSSCSDEFPDEESQRVERERLHELIRDLVKWETADESKLSSRGIVTSARYEIARSVARSHGEVAPTTPEAVLSYLREKTLPIYDPFAGGGSIPLEAQRLGLSAIASDLNPVAVLINKALIELPPKFNDQPPVNPDANPMGMTTGKFIGRGKNRVAEQIPWRGTAGLADDIRYYGRWIRDKAFERIGHLYPKAKLPDGGEATVSAWIWARTIPCANPVCEIKIPLMRTFCISRNGKNRYWAKPIIDQSTKTVSFIMQENDNNVPNNGTVYRNRVTCISCNATAPLTYINQQAQLGNIGVQMICIVAGSNPKRFLEPTVDHIKTAISIKSSIRPTGRLPGRALGISLENYSFRDWHELFSERQITTLASLSNLVIEVQELIEKHGATREYTDALCTYLAISVSKTAETSSIFSRWENDVTSVRGVFSIPAIQVIWDFGESNPFADRAQSWDTRVERIAKVVERLPGDIISGKVHQADASTTIYADNGPVIVTDPPYYHYIGYADISDFFYVWLRLMLRDIYPELFSSILTPKDEEMIASPHRFEEPRRRFENLLRKTFALIREKSSPEFPSSIFYAYKQQEELRDGRASTGWETMLNALVDAGFQIIGTWPVRTDSPNRQRSLGSNALASSVILVCRPRDENAPSATRRQFLNALEQELPDALDHLTRDGHIAPVDLAQAAIGPGMEIYSRYKAVRTIAGDPVPVREALAAINHAVDDYFERQEGEIDSSSRFCLDWLKEHGYAEGVFGEAEVLSQARNVAIESEVMRGLLTAESGRVQLRGMDEYDSERPLSNGMTAWEGCMRMAYHLNREQGGGVEGAARVARAMVGLGENVESVERLARILYNHYDRNRDSANAVAFNNLVTSWQDITAEMQKPESSRLL